MGIENSEQLLPGQVSAPPSEELNRLEIFIGKWIVQGQNLEAAAIGANTIVKGETNYSWLAGHYFILCRWERQFEGGQHSGIGIMGYEEDRSFLSLTNYDNLGFKRAYEVQCNSKSHTWRFTGQRERATIAFSKDGNSFIENWELLSEGSTWKPLCSLQGTKVK